MLPNAHLHVVSERIASAAIPDTDPAANEDMSQNAPLSVPYQGNTLRYGNANCISSNHGDGDEQGLGRRFCR